MILQILAPNEQFEDAKGIIKQQQQQQHSKSGMTAAGGSSRDGIFMTEIDEQEEKLPQPSKKLPLQVSRRKLSMEYLKNSMKNGNRNDSHSNGIFEYNANIDYENEDIDENNSNNNESSNNINDNINDNINNERKSGNSGNSGE